ncbi:MAG TPA: MarR family winged helix-turn-helix transcriptional regulator [Acidimicrobiia bacterium]|jgi:DNA-binding MarR family transcriptional regulator
MTRRDDLRRVDQALARIARMATGREGARLRSERSGVSLSQPAVTILAALRSAGAVRLSELSRLTGLEAPLVSREVGDLAASGHVRRKADPSDGRAGIVALTAKGRRSSEAYREAADEIIAEALSSWSAADLRDLATHLERIVRDFTGTRRGLVAHADPLNS